MILFFQQALAENRRTLGLAFPMIAGQLGQMMMGWADTLMVGRLGVTPLAACAFAIMVIHVFLVFGFGFVSSVSVCVSRAFGAGREREAGEFLWAGVGVAFVAGSAMVALVYLALPWLHLLGQAPEVVREGRGFLVLLAWSIIPALVLIVGKDFSEALSRPWLPFWIMIAGVGLNVGLNWLFIYGNLGFPAMGLSGAGLGTLLARLATVVALFAAIVWGKRYRPYRVRRLPWPLFRSRGAELFKIGWPSGVHLLGEVGLFAACTFLLGTLGVTALAAHQVAITCAATAFMVPLGLAFAVTVRVGHAIGAGEPGRIRPIALGALGMGLLVMTFTGLVFLLGGGGIARWFVDDAAVAALATKLLVIAAAFGLFDAVQIIGMGGLRGMADVRVPMIFVYASYWGIALPVSCVLAFHVGLGAVGIWTGLAIGLACTAAAVSVRFWLKSRKGVPHPVVSEPPMVL